MKASHKRLARNGQASVSGRNLRTWLRGKRPASRGQVAARLVSGELALERPLTAQAARLCSVHQNYIWDALIAK
jgi:hypothetical protein